MRPRVALERQAYQRRAETANRNSHVLRRLAQRLVSNLAFRIMFLGQHRPHLAKILCHLQF